jgi:hypothetical protein
VKMCTAKARTRINMPFSVMTRGVGRKLPSGPLTRAGIIRSCYSTATIPAGSIACQLVNVFGPELQP